MTEWPRVRIGVSSCLLGERVRYDGGHKHDARLATLFGGYVEWVPVCPEAEAGLGTPRESMHLARTAAGRVRLLTVRSRVDLTDRVERFSSTRVDALERQALSGYVFKKSSPTCGVTRVKVYDGQRPPLSAGRGIFAARVVDRFPHLPVEEEGRLCDPTLREHFVERVFAYARVRELFDGRWTRGALIRFHTAHKLTLMAHSPPSYSRLGRLVAAAKTLPRDVLRERYLDGFSAAMATPVSRRRHINVLQHTAGYFKRTLDAASKRELCAVIDDYARGFAGRAAPLTLLQHHVRTHGIEYLAGQRYLNPYPKELRAAVEG